jgi:hypothetical protein
MIGSNSYRSSYQSSYRPRRSFRTLYYLLFVVFAFIIWQSGKLHSNLHDPADALVERDIAKHALAKEEKVEVKRDESLFTDMYGHHVHPPTSPLSPAELSEDSSDKVPVKDEARPLPQKAGLYQAKIKDESDALDTDDVISIKDGSGETVNNEAKLSHPDDDDDTGDTGTEAQDVGGIQQQNLGGGGDFEAQVDTLLKADHPSKEVESDAPEDDSAIEEGPEENENVKHPIETLQEQTAWTEKYQFPSWDECQSLKEKADSLPDMLHVTFEQSVKDVVLEGWEDEWVSKARYTGPRLKEPKIDFVYNCKLRVLDRLLIYANLSEGVNGSQTEFQKSMRPYELNSSLNDEEGLWIASHSTNRYREWNELRYSMRSVEKYASSFTNRIQILVNAFENTRKHEMDPTTYGKQKPYWLNESEKVQVLSQEEFFGPDERKCLPTFDSLTIENQLYNTKSETDRVCTCTIRSFWSSF